MEFEELRQIIAKDFMFYLHINLRKLKDQESDTMVQLFRGLYLLVKKLHVGYAILLDSFTFLKVKKYNMLSLLTLIVLGKLLSSKNVLPRLHKYLQEQSKYYEMDNTMKTLATSLSKRMHNFDKYVEPPFKTSKLFDMNSTIDKQLPVTDANIAQSYFELISSLFECLYKLAEEAGMDLNKGQPKDRQLSETLRPTVGGYSDTVLMCYDLIGSNIMGDYYLNTRNTNIQKMIKLTLYYGLEEISQKIIDFISKECLFQNDVIQKVMMTSKIAINIGQCLPDLQTANTWFKILDFLENLNQNLKKYQKNMAQADKTQSSGVKVNHKSQSTFNSDVTITLASITSLFELSAGFTEDQLRNLMTSVAKILSEFLESKSKKKKSSADSADAECISQTNLGSIWKANKHRIGVVADQTLTILSNYLCHPIACYKEFGFQRAIELIGLLQGNSDKSVIQLQNKIFTLIKDQLNQDETGKLLEFLLTEFCTFFEGLSSDLAEEIWREIFCLLTWAIKSKGIGPKHLDKVFKIVGSVGNHKVSSLSKENVSLFIDLIDAFRTKSDNKNYNYTSLELLWSISDSMKTSPQLSHEQELWRKIFEKLCQSATFPDAQVRNSSLQILSSLLFEYGDHFGDDLWEYALYDLFFQVFDDVLEIYLNLRLQKGTDPEMVSPEAVQTLKASFQSQKVRREKGQAEPMIAHHSGEKLDILWEETFINLIQAFSKISKKYLTRFGAREEQTEKSNQIFQKIFDSLYFVLRLPEREVFVETVKAMKVILSSDSQALITHLKDLLAITDVLFKYLSRDLSENELTKVRQNVIPEVYLMLESFLESGRLFKQESSTEIFFAILYKLIVFQVSNYVDKFKIFLEERYVSVVFKKFPDALIKYGPLFSSHFFKFVEKLYSISLDNSMINVILSNTANKLTDVFVACKGKLTDYPAAVFEVIKRTESLARKIHDEKYVALVKHSKNYKEMIWANGINLHSALLETVLQNPNLGPQHATVLLSDFIRLSQDLRKQKIATFDLVKADCLKEFAMFLLQHPKCLQKLIILCSQQEERPEESFLLSAVEEVRLFEDFLRNEVFKVYQFDSECKGLIMRYCKSLLETNHRILAAVCSDVQKSAEAYLHLLTRYNQGFLEYIKVAPKLSPGAKNDDLRDDVLDHIASLGSIKMDKARAESFIEVAGLNEKQVQKFGYQYCYVPLLAESLSSLIKVDDPAIREAVSNYFRELLLS